MFDSSRVMKLSAILRDTEPVSALKRALVHGCYLYHFFFLGFRQWQSRADRTLSFNS